MWRCAPLLRPYAKQSCFACLPFQALPGLGASGSCPAANPVTLESPGQTLLRLKLSDYRAEVFGIVFMDNRHRIIADEELFQSTIDSASLHPRIVVQRALEVNVAAVLFYHNHASGAAEPSNADEKITRCLKEALALVDFRVLDHFVVSTSDSVSFSERGLL